MEVSSKNKISFPDPLASFEVKKSDAYGLAWGKHIGGDWFGGGLVSNTCEFYKRREYVRQKRLFVRGEQDAAYYKASMSALDYTNLDWEQLNFAEKFARIVSNGLSDKNYKLDIRATDKLSAIKKTAKMDYYMSEILSRQMKKNAQAELGMDLMPRGFIPEDEEEMNIFMEIKERPRIEIAEEVLIDFVLNTNDWSYLEGQFNRDLVDVGINVSRVYTDKHDGIKLAYVDPERYVHSMTKRGDFSDKTYEGVVEEITINDIQRESGFSDIDLRKIAKAYNSDSSIFIPSYDNVAIEDILNHKVNVCRFAFKTTKTIKYKTKVRNDETVKANLKDDNYVKPDRKDVGEISNTFDTWFEGTYVVGTDYIYDYRECENLYDDVMNKAMSPFITVAYDIYENRLRSFTGNIEAPARQLQKFALQIQRLTNELHPDLKEIDLDALAELDDGKGGAKKEIWETALELMTAKGVVFTKRINMGEDGLKDVKAVRPMPIQQGSALTILLNSWAHYYNLIREPRPVSFI